MRPQLNFNIGFGMDHMTTAVECERITVPQSCGGQSVHWTRARVELA